MFTPQTDPACTECRSPVIGSLGLHVSSTAWRRPVGQTVRSSTRVTIDRQQFDHGDASLGNRTPSWGRRLPGEKDVILLSWLRSSRWLRSCLVSVAVIVVGWVVGLPGLERFPLYGFHWRTGSRPFVICTCILVVARLVIRSPACDSPLSPYRQLHPWSYQFGRTSLFVATNCTTFRWSCRPGHRLIARFAVVNPLFNGSLWPETEVCPEFVSVLTVITGISITVCLKHASGGHGRWWVTVSF